MNLLDTSDDLSKKYVANLMRRNNLNSALEGKQHKVKRNGKRLAYILTFGFLCFSVILSVVSNKFPSFVVNADKLFPSDYGYVLGASTSFASTPLTLKSEKSVVSSYVVGDVRSLALQKFLESKKSPMASYASLIVSESDKFGMDYRLIAGISGVESDFGKKTTLRKDGTDNESHNAWGFYKGWQGDPKRFREYGSWSEAIVNIIDNIAGSYGANPSPATMQNIYCYSCFLSGSNKWQEGVKDNMSDIAYIEKSLN